MERRLETPGPIDDGLIDKVGHIIAVPLRAEGEHGYNDKIDVFSIATEGDRAQIYQAWAIGKFTQNYVAMAGLERFGLAGESESKEKWTQLLEHIAGVTAIAEHLAYMLERYGAEAIDINALDEATLYDSLEKPDALETASLVHDLEKPADVEKSGGGGLENSLDNPVLRDGALWRWLQEQGVSQQVIQAAQNTGRDDRFYSDYEDYDEDHVKKAILQREKLSRTLGTPIEYVDAMTPQERRRASIEAKGRMAAIVGVADAMAAQFRFKGLTEEGIDRMSAHYLTYKKDSESVAFFGQDWPEYYKEVRRYLVEQVPKQNRDAFEAKLDSLTHETIFNETVLPDVLGNGNPQAQERLKYANS